jgi:hypothetical protein
MLSRAERYSVDSLSPEPARFAVPKSDVFERSNKMFEMKPRLVRVVDFVAESLEQEAAKMPPSYKDRADALRAAAKMYRELDNPRMIRVWEDS